MADRDGNPGAVTVRKRPGEPALLGGQSWYCTRRFFRMPVAAFFTLIFPLTLLVVVCAVIGNVAIDAQGMHLAQYLVPVFAVFGIAMACFTSLAVHVAGDRETGVLKRLRGTPVPVRTQLAGLIGSRMLVSLLTVGLLVAVGVIAYDVQIVWHRLPALLLTLLIGIACFAALGLAVAALVHSRSAVQAITSAILIPLAFISDVFSQPGTLPDWLSAVGWVFPLRHFANAMSDDFNPYAPDAGVDVNHLLVMIVWAAAAAVVAARYLRFEPLPRTAVRGTTGDKHAGRPGRDQPTANAPPADAVHTPGRPGAGALLRGQVRYGLRGLLRDRSAMFFAVMFPVLLFVFYSAGNTGATWRGVPLPHYLAAVFAVYGITVATYVTLPQAVCLARQRGVIKRLSGTPLPLWAYMAGRIGAAFVIAAVTTIVLLAVGAAAFQVELPMSALPATVLAIAIGTAAFTALGLALAMLIDNPMTVSAVALGTLLPLAFISDIFLLTPTLPTALSAIGWAFPLRHFANAVFQATDPGGTDWAQWWGHLAYLALWGTLAAILAWRLFHRGTITRHGADSPASTGT